MLCLKHSLKVLLVCSVVLPVNAMAEDVQNVAQPPADAIVQPAESLSANPATAPDQQDLSGQITDANGAKLKKVMLPGGQVAFAPLEQDANNRIANEIAEINQRIALLSARYAEIEMQAKISAKVAEIKKSNAVEKKEQDKTVEARTSSASSTSAPVVHRVEESPSMSVKEISGVDGDLRAILSLRNGTSRSVKVSDKVSGWVVKNIQVDFVEVEKGGKVVSLPFGSFVSSSAPKSYVSQASTPPMPPTSIGSISPIQMPLQ